MFWNMGGGGPRDPPWGSMTATRPPGCPQMQGGQRNVDLRSRSPKDVTVVEAVGSGTELRHTPPFVVIPPEGPSPQVGFPRALPRATIRTPRLFERTAAVSKCTSAVSSSVRNEPHFDASSGKRGSSSDPQDRSRHLERAIVPACSLGPETSFKAPERPDMISWAPGLHSPAPYQAARPPHTKAPTLCAFATSSGSFAKKGLPSPRHCNIEGCPWRLG